MFGLSLFLLNFLADPVRADPEHPQTLEQVPVEELGGLSDEGQRLLACRRRLMPIERWVFATASPDKISCLRQAANEGNRGSSSTFAASIGRFTDDEIQWLYQTATNPIFKLQVVRMAYPSLSSLFPNAWDDAVKTARKILSGDLASDEGVVDALAILAVTGEPSDIPLINNPATRKKYGPLVKSLMVASRAYRDASIRTSVDSHGRAFAQLMLADLSDLEARAQLASGKPVSPEDVHHTFDFVLRHSLFFSDPLLKARLFALALLMRNEVAFFFAAQPELTLSGERIQALREMAKNSIERKIEALRRGMVDEVASEEPYWLYEFHFLEAHGLLSDTQALLDLELVALDRTENKGQQRLATLVQAIGNTQKKIRARFDRRSVTIPPPEEPKKKPGGGGPTGPSLPRPEASKTASPSPPKRSITIPPKR